MGAEVAASATGPPRRRDSWSLKTIVEDIAGKPIGEFQDPARPVHPYLKQKLGSTPPPSPAPRAAPPPSAELWDDPVSRVYPPLTGETGRSLHGPEGEHPAALVHEWSKPAEGAGPGVRPHAPGPSRRPERVYLHYLLLHIDRLNDTALRYLHRAVEEELHHREAALKESPPAGP